MSSVIYPFDKEKWKENKLKKKTLMSSTFENYKVLVEITKYLIWSNKVDLSFDVAMIGLGLEIN